MSQQHILNDAHFPLWFTTLENVVEGSRHCLSHSAALSHNVCNTAAAAQGVFTGVKCIWQCNKPLGYIYFPAKESAQLQVKRVVNAYNTVSLMLLGTAREKAQLLQELARAPCFFHFLAMKGSHTVSVGNRFSSCEQNCSFSVVCEQASP